MVYKALNAGVQQTRVITDMSLKGLVCCSVTWNTRLQPNKIVSTLKLKSIAFGLNICKINFTIIFFHLQYYFTAQSPS